MHSGSSLILQSDGSGRVSERMALFDVCVGHCGLVVRVPSYRTEMYCASCEVRTEFIYVM
jgi:hypothetical protein